MYLCEIIRYLLSGLRESSDPGTTKANLPLCHMTWTRKELRVDVTSEPYILDSTVAQPRSQNYSDFVCVVCHPSITLLIIL